MLFFTRFVLYVCAVVSGIEGAASVALAVKDVLLGSVEDFAMKTSLIDGGMVSDELEVLKENEKSLPMGIPEVSFMVPLIVIRTLA